ncbi:MAG: alpha/beta hydrolase [Pseudomonadota bacterium]
MIFSKQAVQNRHGKNILVHYEPCPKASNQLAVIQHGYSGSMNEVHIKIFGKTYLDNGYNVLMLDCTNSHNDADGILEDNTIQSHYDDLEDSIQWAATQDWYQEPFSLAGHSLGGLSIMAYAGKNLEKVSSIFPAAMVVSGQLLEQRFEENDPEYMNKMRTEGKVQVDCSYKEGVTGFRPYSWFASMYDWDAREYAKNINALALCIVGDEDYLTSPQDQKAVFDHLKGPNKVHVIKGCDHCYEGKEEELSTVLDQLLKEIND